MSKDVRALLPFENFAAATEAALSYLQEHTGFALWMMTRTDGEDWTVLQSRDRRYGVTPGTVFRWADTFCARMVAGAGPRVAPDALQVPVYMDAGMVAEVPIGAYIGVPIFNEDGTLFGTLCAVDPERQDDRVSDNLPLIELIAGLLASLLAVEQRASRMARLYEQVQEVANTDVLTGIFNRRGWQDSLAREEARAQRYGSPCSVFVIDLDELKFINDTQGHDQGDELLRRAALCLRAAVRSGDFVARIGGDEFAVLAVECNKSQAAVVAENIRRELRDADISASLGYATRDPLQGLDEAMKVADRRMYEEKLSARRDSETSQEAGFD
ncbi:MAG: sensor domain-containing diguanylate cyclase [Porticoccaceae bacterium]